MRAGRPRKPEALDATAERTRRFNIARGLAALALVVGMSAWIIRGLTRQIGGDPALAQAIVGEVAGGDLTFSIPLRAGDVSSLLAATARSLSHCASEQAASVEETSASVEQMSATIGHNSEIVRSAGSAGSGTAAPDGLFQDRAGIGRSRPRHPWPDG